MSLTGWVRKRSIECLIQVSRRLMGNRTLYEKGAVLLFVELVFDPWSWHDHRCWCAKQGSCPGYREIAFISKGTYVDTSTQMMRACLTWLSKVIKLIISSRIIEKQVQLLAEHSRQLRTGPWMLRCVELVICAFGTFLFRLPKRTSFMAFKYLCVFWRQTFARTTF